MNKSSIKYTLTEFEHIKNNYNIPELNNASIQIINNISKKVGAPTYRKTPVFKKKKQEQKYSKNFVKTSFVVKNDENIINQDKIRELLNKLTNNNYNEISDEIITNIKHFIYTQNDMILMDFGKSIFDISSVNKFWVKLYAKLFNKLIDHFPKMRDICLTHFKILLNIFDNIRFGNEEEYDTFCEINKENEKRRSLLSFYTELYKYDILGNDEIQILVDKMFCLIYESKEKNLTEEIFENINIIIKELGDVLLNEPLFDIIQEKLIEFYNKINKNNTSKKIKFKLLDIFEEFDIDDYELDENDE